ncbi:MAG: 4-hydroxy-tetrahydrodipicolinate reductase [Cyanobacteria bacterium REEB67]|nr:4-hydroxy-tetrahydrodipicolinate reductase [Cyanobacteria bacterium REEB67]
MSINVCLAGVTGWTGAEVARGITESADLKLVGACSRKGAGRDVGNLLGQTPIGLKVVSTVEEALQSEARVDVFIDYTAASSVKRHVLTALEHGVATVVGSSGLSAEDYAEIEKLALEKSVGVIACGNFSITAALAKHFALIAARHLPHWEIIEYAHATKPDVPSGTARELAEELAGVRANKLGRPLAELSGPLEARGAQIGGTPVHSVRLPGYVIAFETIFGLPDERLTIRHDAGASARPYVDGTLLAVRKVQAVKGLVRGLDRLLLD